MEIFGFFSTGMYSLRFLNSSLEGYIQNPCTDRRVGEGVPRPRGGGVSLDAQPRPLVLACLHRRPELACLRVWG